MARFLSTAATARLDPPASGRFTDTWQGPYRTRKVALKAFRTYPIQDLREAEKVCRAVLVNLAFIFNDPSRSYGRR